MRIKLFLKKIIPESLIELYYYIKAFFPAFAFGFPSKKIKFIAITGTKGKTTTAYILYKILKPQFKNLGLISSMYIDDGKNFYKNKFDLTMPTVFLREKLARKMLKNNVKYVIFEVTSEGIKNKRHLFANYIVCCILNLEPEHIEHHGSFEKYKNAKLELFKYSQKSFSGFDKEKIFLFNLDCKNLKDFIEFSKNKKGIRTIGISTKKNLYEFKDFAIKRIYSLRNFALNSKSSIFSLYIYEKKNNKFILKDKLRHIELNLPGKVNILNSIFSISIVYELNFDVKKAIKAFKDISCLEGRFEVLAKDTIKLNLPFPTIIIDYAHTPNSFREIFKEAKRFIKKNKGKIISVFGSAGGIRDKWKRPVLGKIASLYSDIIILTNEDPYWENEKKIIEDIYKGITKTKKCFKIIDRKKAIKKALTLATPNDIVLILGKGAEDYIHSKNKLIPHNDKKITIKILKSLYDRNS